MSIVAEAEGLVLDAPPATILLWFVAAVAVAAVAAVNPAPIPVVAGESVVSSPPTPVPLLRDDLFCDVRKEKKE